MFTCTQESGSACRTHSAPFARVLLLPTGRGIFIPTQNATCAACPCYGEPILQNYSTRLSLLQINVVFPWIHSSTSTLLNRVQIPRTPQPTCANSPKKACADAGLRKSLKKSENRSIMNLPSSKNSATKPISSPYTILFSLPARATSSARDAGLPPIQRCASAWALQRSTRHG